MQFSGTRIDRKYERKTSAIRFTESVTSISHTLSKITILCLIPFLFPLLLILATIGAFPDFFVHIIDRLDAWVVVLWTCRFFQLRKWTSFARSKCYGLPPTSYTASFESIDTAVVGDGLVLRATLVRPKEIPKETPLPVVLMRTPYGRSAEFGQTVLAEQGYNVVVQDTRGRFGSDGTFVPVQTEKEDGSATIEWLKKQPWYNGKLAVYGISYLGFTAWACVGGESGDEVDAIVPVITSSAVRPAVFRHGGAISLELVVTWIYLVLKLLQGTPAHFLFNCLVGWLRGTVDKALMHLPLKDLDVQLTGQKIPFFQDGIAHPEEDGVFWKDANKLCDFTRSKIPPAHIVTGWYDFFLDECLEDYTRAKKSRKDEDGVRLSVGGFYHWGLLHPTTQKLMYSCLLSHLDQELRGNKFYQHTHDAFENSTDPNAPVQLFLLRAERWCGFHSWPPESHSKSLSLLSNGSLQWHRTTLPNDPGYVSYEYDPHHPTPAVGGPSFHPINGGCRDQSSIEKRDDVITFTTVPLAQSLRVIGKVSAQIFVSSTARSVDVVARLCLVTTDERGRKKSVNLCEDLTRVTVTANEGEPVCVKVEVGSIAVEFMEGDCIRLTICSAAHPRWMRNTGDDSSPIAERVIEQDLTGPFMQRIWTSSEFPSSLHLPICEEGL